MERQFSTFYLGAARFAVDILLIKEINRHLEITEVAGAPEFIRGLLNLRGKIVTVFDLAVRFALPAQEIDNYSRCIILKTTAELAPHQAAGLLDDDTGPDVVGLLVDRIGDMVAIDDEAILSTPASVGGVESKFIAGVIRLAEELIIVLRARATLAVSSSS